MTASAHPTTVPDPAAVFGDGELILYIDPDGALCREVASHLANLGYRIITSTASLDAVQMLLAQRNDVDIAIFDSAMPAIDGMPLARALGMVNPKLHLFALMSEATTALPALDHTLNIRGRIQKPATTSVVCEALTTALSSMRRL